MAGGEEYLWFLDTLKHFQTISELILPEKTLKEIKIVFFKIEVTTNNWELFNFGHQDYITQWCFALWKFAVFASEIKVYNMEKENLYNIVKENFIIWMK